MSRTTIGYIPAAEQARMLTGVRQARYGYLLALHLLLLCAAGRTPTEIAGPLSPGKWHCACAISSAEVIADDIANQSPDQDEDFKVDG